LRKKKRSIQKKRGKRYKKKEASIKYNSRGWKGPTGKLDEKSKESLSRRQSTEKSKSNTNERRRIRGPEKPAGSQAKRSLGKGWGKQEGVKMRYLPRMNRGSLCRDRGLHTRGNYSTDREDLGGGGMYSWEKDLRQDRQGGCWEK